MRIALKLTAAFLAIASLVGAAGYLAQRTTVEVRAQIGRLRESAVPRIVGASQTTTALYALQLAAHELVSDERRGGREASVASDRQDAIEHQWMLVEQGLERLRLAAKSRARWDAEQETAEREWTATPPLIQEKWLSYQQLLHDMRGMAEQDADRAEQFLERQLWKHFQSELLPLLVAQREQSEQELTEAINSVERSLAVADTQRGMLTLAAAASAIGIGLIMSRSIGRPLAILQKAAREVGRGRLGTRVTIRSRDEIGVLGVALNQMAADLQDKTVSRSYLENIIQSMREMLIVADGDTMIRRLNPNACSELGCAPEALIGRPLRELFVDETLTADPGFPGSLAEGVELMMRSQTQGPIPVHCSVAEMRNETGHREGFVCVASNISRQKDVERQLLASLREKELLLKEVHHRVKNNLQVISSLLNLQVQEVRDPQMIRLLQESQGRVRSLALIHEQLYHSQDLSQIDFAAYVQELVEHLIQGVGKSAARVRFRFDVQPCQLPIDLAIPCGMIVNELVCNALEHAFPQGRSGTIRIAFASDAASYRLTVADDGVGLPDGLDPGKQGALGLKVVQALTRQIHGRLELQHAAGAVFTIQFSGPSSHGPSQPPP
jgi:PAS domain S-box-containing protein